MSFMGGGSAADCGPANPMAGLMKQFGQDRSLQQVSSGFIQQEKKSPICSSLFPNRRIALVLNKEVKVAR
jgi:hypothetical protein